MGLHMRMDRVEVAKFAYLSACFYSLGYGVFAESSAKHLPRCEIIDVTAVHVVELLDHCFLQTAPGILYLLFFPPFPLCQGVKLLPN